MSKKCPSCSSFNISRKLVHKTIQQGSQTIYVNCTGFECHQCGELFYVKETLDWFKTIEKRLRYGETRYFSKIEQNTYYVVLDLLRILELSQAEKDKVITLYLTGCGLHELPAEINTLRNLEELGLTGNQLKTLPDSMSGLVKLKILYLSQNQFDSIPTVLYQLPNLTNLYLKNNNIAFIDAEISRLRNLKGLFLQGNSIRVISNNIGKLKKLQILTLDNNKLKKLPKALFHLSELEVLSVSSNLLKVIPYQIQNLRKLSVLSLHDNQLKTLPITLIKLPIERLSLLENPKLLIPNSVLVKTTQPRHILGYFYVHLLLNK